MADREEEDFYFKSSIGPKLEGLRIGTWNIARVSNKMDLLKAVIYTHQFDIFVVVESWLMNPKQPESIEGYHSLQANRTHGEGGGILIYIRGHNEVDQIRHTEYREGTDSKEDPNTKVQLAMLKINEPIKLDLVAVYSPSEQSATSLCDMLKTSEENSRNNYKMWLGDMNINLRSRNSPAIKLRSTLKVQQIIKQCTRVEFGKARLIDHIFTDIPGEEIVEKGVIRTTFSDHDIVYCTIKIDDIILKTKMLRIGHFSKTLADISKADTTFQKVIKRIHKVSKNLCESSYSALSMILAPDIVLKIEAVESLSTDGWLDGRKKWMKVKHFRVENDKHSRSGYAELSKVICSDMATKIMSGRPPLKVDSEISKKFVKTSLLIQLARLAVGMGLWTEIEEFQQIHCNDEVVKDLHVILLRMFSSFKINEQCDFDIGLSPRSWTRWLLFSTFEFILAANINLKLKWKPKTREETVQQFKTFVEDAESVVAAWIFRFEHVAWDSTISLKLVYKANTLSKYLDFRKEDTRMPESNYILATALSAQVKQMENLVKDRAKLQLFQCGNEVSVCLRCSKIKPPEGSDIVPQEYILDTQNILYRLHEMGSSENGSPQHLVFQDPNLTSAVIDKWNETLTIKKRELVKPKDPLPTVDFLGVKFDSSLTDKVYARDKEVTVLKTIRQIRQASCRMGDCVEEMCKPFVSMLKSTYPQQEADINYHIKPKLPYRCKVKNCHKSFQTENERSKHENHKHFVCLVCDKMYQRRETPENCQICGTRNPCAPYRCKAKACPDSFQTEVEQLNHQNEKHFVCPQCNKVLKNIQSPVTQQHKTACRVR